MQTNRFEVIIIWGSDKVVIVEAATDLRQAVWAPVGTNTLTGGSARFSDAQWAQHRGRFFRVRSPNLPTDLQTL
jgi:hypothetical protein